VTAAREPRRRRHPLRATIIVLVVLAVLLGSAYYVADMLARQFATSFVKTGVTQELGASASHVHVSLSKSDMIMQLVHKHIKSMDVTISDFTSGTIAGADAVFLATQVPLNTSDPAGTISITAKIGPTGLLGLVDAKAGTTATVTFQGANLRIATTEKIHGKSIPVSVDYLPSASGPTTLLLTPVTITVGTKQYTPPQFKASPYEHYASALAVPRAQCLAASLPTSLKLTAISVVGQQLIITSAGSEVSLGSLSTKGTCPA
jgi:hypothetical protein